MSVTVEQARQSLSELIQETVNKKRKADESGPHSKLESMGYANQLYILNQLAMNLGWHMIVGLG